MLIFVSYSFRVLWETKAQVSSRLVNSETLGKLAGYIQEQLSSSSVKLEHFPARMNERLARASISNVHHCQFTGRAHVVINVNPSSQPFLGKKPSEYLQAVVEVLSEANEVNFLPHKSLLKQLALGAQRQRKETVVLKHGSLMTRPRPFFPFL